MYNIMLEQREPVSEIQSKLTIIFLHGFLFCSFIRENVSDKLLVYCCKSFTQLTIFCNYKYVLG